MRVRSEAQVKSAEKRNKKKIIKKRKDDRKQ